MLFVISGCGHISLLIQKCVLCCGPWGRGGWACRSPPEPQLHPSCTPAQPAPGTPGHPAPGQLPGLSLLVPSLWRKRGAQLSLLPRENHGHSRITKALFWGEKSILLHLLENRKQRGLRFQSIVNLSSESPICAFHALRFLFSFGFSFITLAVLAVVPHLAPNALKVTRPPLGAGPAPAYWVRRQKKEKTRELEQRPQKARPRLPSAAAPARGWRPAPRAPLIRVLFAGRLGRRGCHSHSAS